METMSSVSIGLLSSIAFQNNFSGMILFAECREEGPIGDLDKFEGMSLQE
jgi:hypothetical protein